MSTWTEARDGVGNKSITTFALGTRALHDWLDGEWRELARSLLADDATQPRRSCATASSSRSAAPSRSGGCRSWTACYLAPFVKLAMFRSIPLHATADTTQL